MKYPLYPYLKWALKRYATKQGTVGQVELPQYIIEEYKQCNSYSQRRVVDTWFASYNESLKLIGDKLPNLKMPALITWGKQDDIVLVENAYGLHERIPNSKLHIFENASHFSIQEAGPEWLDIYTNWINQEHKNF